MYNFNPYQNIPMPNNQTNNNNMQMPQTYPNVYGANYGQRSAINQYTYVNGFEGAKAFNIGPNQSVLLMDSDNPMFYLKTSNNLGQATLRKFRFEEILEDESKPAMNFVSIDEYKKLYDKVENLEKLLKSNAKSFVEQPTSK